MKKKSFLKKEMKGEKLFLKEKMYVYHKVGKKINNDNGPGVLWSQDQLKYVGPYAVLGFSLTRTA